MPYRIVGSHEYMSAVNQLIPLVETSTKSEMKVYDKILADQNEFSFHSGVVLAAANDREYQRPEKRLFGSERFQRKGLAWLMALARIELGATLAMYGRLENAFDFVAPDGFGRDEYFELLLHDAAVHVNALKTDPLLIEKSHAKADVNSETVAYLRRLRIVYDMLLATRVASDGRFANSADEYLNAVNLFAKRLKQKGESAIGTSVESSSTVTADTHTSSSTFIRAERGTVTAVSPITRDCQRAFLGRFGR